MIVDATADGSGLALDASDGSMITDAAVDGQALDAQSNPCPAGMAQVSPNLCMDRYEAPNRPGALPFVMFSFNEAAS
ncbi:MAG: hypothetical protein J7M25_14085 [Deltaproteobacteria bacterium]|nr:hypothetical protein [Deltaproteobacteria bacterium]